MSIERLINDVWIVIYIGTWWSIYPLKPTVAIRVQL